MILPALYKTVSHHQFLFTTVKLWNTLSPEIKEIQDRTMRLFNAIVSQLRFWQF